jgi:hypothetical protein
MSHLPCYQAVAFLRRDTSVNGLREESLWIVRSVPVARAGKSAQLRVRGIAGVLPVYDKETDSRLLG